MNILLITDSFPPEIRSGSHLMYELAIELRNRGHKITVLTAKPRYNLVGISNKKYFQDNYWEEAIQVIRVNTLPIHNISYVKRGFGQLSLLYFFTKGAKKYITSNVDIILVYSPPLPLGIAGLRLKKHFGAKLILNIQDIFPQHAIDLGIIRNKFIISFFEWMERIAYKNADSITVHSIGNRNYLINHKNIHPEKISIIHNWVDLKSFEMAPNNGKFRSEYGLNSKFIVLFAGVLGPAQGLDIIIDAAYELRDRNDIVFLIVGDGTEKGSLLMKIKEKSLQNVVFKHFVSKEDYPELVKDSDIGLVCLSEKNKTPAVPGKLVGYMAGGIPVLASLQKESDGHHIIKSAGCGISISSGDRKEFTKALLKLYENAEMRKEMGRNGIDYVRKYFTKEKCVGEYEKIFSNLVT